MFVCFSMQGEVGRRFVLSVRPLEPKLPVTKNQRGRYYYQDLSKSQEHRRKWQQPRQVANRPELCLRMRTFYSILGENIWSQSSLLLQHLILEKVSEDEELRKRIAHSAETRVPRKQPISVRREEVTESGGAGEPALWKNTGTGTEPEPATTPLGAPSQKGGGDMAGVGPEGAWEKPNGDNFQKSGVQTSPEMSMFESM